MGYETPSQIPSMQIYDTDLMKMYIAGVKDQYEKGQEEMKDFMKLYGDFYSPVAGATEAYNNMTIGGARRMIDQMLANGIDPYKSPEARAAISRYIASVPTGRIKELEQQREDYTKYQDAVRNAIANGTYNAQMEDYYLQKEGLNNFQAINPDGSVNKWTRLSPSRFVTLESITNPFFKDLEKTDFVGNDPRHPGYSLYKVADERLTEALRGGVEAVRNNPNGDFYVYLAEKKLNNAGITRETNPENYDQLVAQQLAQDVQNANAQAWQTKSDWDKYGQEMRGYAQDIKMEGIRHNNRMIESGYKWDPKTKKWIAPGGGDEDPEQPEGLSITNDLYANGLGKLYNSTGTSDISAAQAKTLSRYINYNIKQKSDDSKKLNAKNLLDKHFKQDLTGRTFTLLAIGQAVSNGTFNYRPGRDDRRLRTYSELGNSLNFGSNVLVNTKGKRINQKMFSNQTGINELNSSEALLEYLHSQYDPANPEKVQIVHDGGAYVTYGADKYLRGNAPVSIVINGEKKFQVPYEMTVGLNLTNGMQDTSRSAEGVYQDQQATSSSGVGKNTKNRTVVLK